MQASARVSRGLEIGTKWLGEMNGNDYKWVLIKNWDYWSIGVGKIATIL